MLLTDAVSVICDLLEFVGVSEKTLSLACGGMNVSALRKQSYLYERLTFAVAQVVGVFCVFMHVFCRITSLGLLLLF